ncbi:MAG: archaellin/type IV pilin N-terminal domain-containing protein [Candidatus Woesearchaeota archaeon]
MYKKAEMGVGTLIVFIAMLLVAAIAAGVLIQTVGSLQEKSLATGQQAKTQISTNVDTIEVSATDGRNSKLTEFEQRMKLSSGSDPIKLAEVIITLTTHNSSLILKYSNNTLCQRNKTHGYSVNETTNEGVFTVIYEQEGSNYVPGNLQRGDGIRICYGVATSVGPDELIRINFIPKTGSSIPREFITPTVISTQRVYLYP